MKTIDKCPACGGEKLRDGDIGVTKHVFVPEGSTRWRWKTGHLAKGFVCLDCGFLGHYIPEAALKEIREGPL